MEACTFAGNPAEASMLVNVPRLYPATSLVSGCACWVFVTDPQEKIGNETTGVDQKQKALIVLEGLVERSICELWNERGISQTQYYQRDRFLGNAQLEYEVVIVYKRHPPWTGKH